MSVFFEMGRKSSEIFSFARGPEKRIPNFDQFSPPSLAALNQNCRSDPKFREHHFRSELLKCKTNKCEVRKLNWVLLIEGKIIFLFLFQILTFFNVSPIFLHYFLFYLFPKRTLISAQQMALLGFLTTTLFRGVI